MPKGQIEHANITVTNPERSAKLFEEMCDWQERWRGPSQMGGETIHVGDDTTYLAIYTNEKAKGGYSKGVPLNHIGLLVDDLDGAEAIVVKHGLEPFGHDDYEPGRRFYFFDWDGIEFEVVSYA
ncbi:VOC family protein [Altererythrobacter sp. MF3-039]|uniref:VOC family protein n=1 Tax=Altererythrobacter sp. MF3-039 TaxID=3252901 RepID=UPI00390CCD3B